MKDTITNRISARDDSTITNKATIDGNTISTDKADTMKDGNTTITSGDLHTLLTLSEQAATIDALWASVQGNELLKQESAYLRSRSIYYGDLYMRQLHRMTGE